MPAQDGSSLWFTTRRQWYRQSVHARHETRESGSGNIYLAAKSFQFLCCMVKLALRTIKLRVVQLASSPAQSWRSSQQTRRERRRGCSYPALAKTAGCINMAVAAEERSASTSQAELQVRAFESWLAMSVTQTGWHIESMLKYRAQDAPSKQMNLSSSRPKSSWLAWMELSLSHKVSLQSIQKQSTAIQSSESEAAMRDGWYPNKCVGSAFQCIKYPQIMI